jgi:hypothetical protein
LIISLDKLLFSQRTAVTERRWKPQQVACAPTERQAADAKEQRRAERQAHQRSGPVKEAISSKLKLQAAVTLDNQILFSITDLNNL